MRRDFRKKQVTSPHSARQDGERVLAAINRGDAIKSWKSRRAAFFNARSRGNISRASLTTVPIRDDEPMRLQANMNIVVHPVIGSDSLWVLVCDNYLITEGGASSRLHKCPQEIFSVQQHRVAGECG